MARRIVFVPCLFQLLVTVLVYAEDTMEGTTFFFGIPRVNFHLTTIDSYFAARKQTKVTISVPNLDAHELKLPENQFVKYSFQRNQTTGHIGIYKAISVKATRPILMYLDLRTPVNSDFVNVIPLNACVKSFYVRALPGHVFLSVTTFYKSEIKVKFIPLGLPYRRTCEGNKPCQPGSEVTVDLKPASVWYFSLPKPGVEIHHSTIESNQPVFAMSGNTQCYFTNGPVTRRDMCTTVISSCQAWGTDYVLPYFPAERGRMTLVKLRFNLLKYPQTFTLLEGNSSTKIVVKNPLYTKLMFGIHSVAIIESDTDTAFGLTMYYGQGKLHNSGFSIGMLALVPVHQWIALSKMASMTQEMLRRNYYEVFIVSNVHAVQASSENVGERMVSVKGTRHTYHFTTVKVRKSGITYFSAKPQSRVFMMYIHSKPDGYSCSIRPLYFKKPVDVGQGCSPGVAAGKPTTASVRIHPTKNTFIGTENTTKGWFQSTDDFDNKYESMANWGITTDSFSMPFWGYLLIVAAIFILCHLLAICRNKFKRKSVAQDEWKDEESSKREEEAEAQPEALDELQQADDDQAEQNDQDDVGRPSDGHVGRDGQMEQGEGQGQEEMLVKRHEQMGPDGQLRQNPDDGDGATPR